MIKRLIVKNLNGRFDFDLTFNRDLNIIVGKNGSGKTSLLKLMWYVYSGNMKKCASNTIFDEVKLETFEGRNIKIEYNKERRWLNIFMNDRNIGKHAIGTNSSVNFSDKSTIFMPTFRRIEGVFSSPMINDALSGSLNNLTESQKRNYPNNEMDKIISHSLVASVSNNDIINVVTAKYSDISQQLRKIEEEQSEFILSNTQNGNGSQKALKEIEQRVLADNKKRKKILNSMTVLSNLVNKILKGKKIQLTEKLSLGEGKEAISPDKLSFGEKQMLSFLCYNFFSDNSIIFIDEPEMSLHGDWQRLLFPVLMEQDTTNQFIVATHSPFIYAKYPDKQIVLSQDKEVIA